MRDRTDVSGGTHTTVEPKHFSCPACGADVLRTPHGRLKTWRYTDTTGAPHARTCASPLALLTHRRADEHWCYQHPREARQR